VSPPFRTGAPDDRVSCIGSAQITCCAKASNESLGLCRHSRRDYGNCGSVCPVEGGVRDIILVDERRLTLTSERSTECYRNWWPEASMLALMNRSIDLMEGMARRSGNVFSLNRRGYLYLTGDAAAVPDLARQAARISRLGGGPLRTHTRADSDYQRAEPEGYEGAQDGRTCA
jgi:hypothetical protein